MKTDKQKDQLTLFTHVYSGRVVWFRKQKAEERHMFASELK